MESCGEHESVIPAWSSPRAEQAGVSVSLGHSAEDSSYEGFLSEDPLTTCLLLLL